MLKFEKERDFGGIGIYSMSDNYIAPENSFQPWRICSVETSLAYVIILIFSWNLQYSGNSTYGQEPFPSSGVGQIENRNLRASGSSRWLSRISGYVLKVLQYATSEVRVPKTLTFKMRLDAQSFLWKWVLLALLITYPRFETEAQGNSEIAYYRYCLSWSSGSLWLCWPIRVRCFFLISRASVSSRYSSSSSFRCLPRPLPLWLPCLSIVTSL